MTKRILITGKNSYIGTSLEKWLKREPNKYKVSSISLKGESWKEKDFSQYDVVFHVAAMVHQKEEPAMKALYFKVNKDLPIEVANKTKEAGVSQFIFLSTMAVYGEEGKIGEEVVITRKSPVNPKSLYGISKVEAETELKKLNDGIFKVVIVRPPMVYGPNCPGNFANLEKFAVKSPIFPMIENNRSMVNIDRLCQSVKNYIDNEEEGIFFPQDDEYVNTSLMVKKLAEENGKSIYLSKFAGQFIKLIGKNNSLISKVFGNLVYEKDVIKGVEI